MVQEKYNSIEHNTYNNYTFSREKILKFISKLKSGRAPGCDGICAEHLKHSINTDAPLYLKDIFTVCVRFGVIPKTFLLGIIVPILKKPTLDPTVPKHYRPVIVSTILSKVMEHCILEDCSGHKFEMLQFGFIEKRGTSTSICMANDIVNYFNVNGSAVYTCALDAEMAFDGIPHSILLMKAIDVIPDTWWRLMYVWYHNSYVQVKWNGKLSNFINIEKGTRQGGLTSPFLFNLFYQDLVHGLTEVPGGLRIDGNSYCVLVYADDILLMSTTATGLQKLIDYSNDYIREHGLSFNPSKTMCTTFGKSHLTPSPTWTLGGNILSMSDDLDHLGAVLSNHGYPHIQKRIKSCRQGFYGLQGGGMCSQGVKPEIVSYLWRSALQPILLYAIQALPMRQCDMKDLESLQGKLIKSSLGFSKYLRTKPLLNALYINSINRLRDIFTMDLFKGMILSTSSARPLYCYFMKKFNAYSDNKFNNLVTRTKSICFNYNINAMKYVFNDAYSKECRKKLKMPAEMKPGHDGLTDSVRDLLVNFDCHNKEFIRLLLMPF